MRPTPPIPVNKHLAAEHDIDGARKARVKVSKAMANYYRDSYRQDVRKHLAGQHDQSSHGTGGGVPGIESSGIGGGVFSGAGAPAVAEDHDVNEDVSNLDVTHFATDLERLSAQELSDKYGGHDKVRSLLRELQHSALLSRQELNRPDSRRVKNVTSMLNKMRDRVHSIDKHLDATDKDHDQSDHAPKKKAGAGQLAIPGTGGADVPLAGRPKAPAGLPNLDPKTGKAKLLGVEAASVFGDDANPSDLDPRDAQKQTTLRRTRALLDDVLENDRDPWEAQDEFLDILADDESFGPEYVQHVRDQMAKTNEIYAEGKAKAKGKGPMGEAAGLFATEHLYDHVEGVEGLYTPEREQVHQRVVDAFFEARQHVPTNNQSIILGGLPGSGKTYSLENAEDLQNALGITDLDGEYLRINPDDIKEILVEQKLVPDYTEAGLSPMEAAYLMHEESSVIAWQIATRAQADGTNVAWDITLGSHASGIERMDQLSDQSGPVYEQTLLYVDVPPEVSLYAAMERHRQGMTTNKGGRLVPPAINIEAVTKGKGGQTANRVAFEKLKGEADRYYVADNWQYDSSGVRQGAKLLDSGVSEQQRLGVGVEDGRKANRPAVEQRALREKARTTGDPKAMKKLGFGKAARPLSPIVKATEPDPVAASGSETPDQPAPERPKNPLGTDPARAPKGSTPAVRGGELTKLIESYRGGERNLQGLGDELERFNFKPIEGYADLSDDPFKRAYEMEGINFDQDGTWGEVRRAKHHGLLSNAEYLNLHERVFEKHTGEKSNAHPLPQTGEETLEPASVFEGAQNPEQEEPVAPPAG